MKKGINLILATIAALSVALPLAADANAKKRDAMSEKEKKTLRQRARDYCTKTYVKGTSELERIEIKSDGKVVCWIRN